MESDEELYRRTRAGDIAAFDALYEVSSIGSRRVRLVCGDTLAMHGLTTHTAEDAVHIGEHVLLADRARLAHHPGPHVDAVLEVIRVADGCRCGRLAWLRHRQRPEKLHEADAHEAESQEPQRTELPSEGHADKDDSAQQEEKRSGLGPIAARLVRGHSTSNGNRERDQDHLGDAVASVAVTA
jgi:hypothetical protein